MTFQNSLCIALLAVMLVACGGEKEATAEQVSEAADKTALAITKAQNVAAKAADTVTAVAPPVAKEEKAVAKPKLAFAAANADFHAAIMTAQYAPQQVAERTYVIHGPTETPNKANGGFMNNPGFVVGSESVVVIDPGSSVQVGRAVAMRIKEITDKPVTHVFTTHVHGDHWLANHGLQEAWPQATFYAHPKMIEMANNGEAESWVSLMENLTEGFTKGTKAVIPDQALEHVQELKVGDITIRAHFTGHAHTLTDVMFEIDGDKVLFTGDNITYKRIARMADGHFEGNIAAADYAMALPIEVVVPGHGPTGGKEVLQAFRNYLSIVYETTKVLMEEGLESFEMKDQVVARLGEYKDWPGLHEEVGKHIISAMTEIEEASF